jgi:U3 small nucleolar RNA-associated protein 22
LLAPTPSGLPPEWQGVFATPVSDFDAFLLLRKEALPQADQALVPPPPLPAVLRQLVPRVPDKRRGRKALGGQGAAGGLSAVLLPPGAAVRDLLHSGGVEQLDAPLSGPDALSDALEGAGPMEPPPKRARAFLRCFPDKVVAARGPARLQPELLVGMDPVGRLTAELAAGYGHLATFCVDGLGGRLVGVRWLPDAFLPQPLRLNSAHTALPLVLTGSGPGQSQEGQQRTGGGPGGVRVCVPNVFSVLREVKEMGLGLVEDWLMPPSSAKAQASW